MTLLVSVPDGDRLAYGFIQKTLGLTGGNLTIHLRKLQGAGCLNITKEFQGSKPRTWAQATTAGRRAFAEYLSNLQRALGFRVAGLFGPVALMMRLHAQVVSRLSRPIRPRHACGAGLKFACLAAALSCA